MEVTELEVENEGEEREKNGFSVPSLGSQQIMMSSAKTENMRM